MDTDQAPGPPLLTRPQLAAVGYDDRSIRRARASGDITIVRRGLYSPTSETETLDDAARHRVAVRAALHRVGDPVAVSHQSAAVVAGLPLIAIPSAVTLTRQRRCYAKFPDLRVYRASLPPEHLRMLQDLTVTREARTVVDVARHDTFAAGLVLADAALRAGRCDVEELLQVLADCAGWPGIRKATAVVAHADPRAETPLESLSRAGMIICRIPLPELQQWLTGADGKSYRTDFLWRKQRLIGESDGRIKYASPEALWLEKQRQDALHRAGYRFVRWGWREAVNPFISLQPLIMSALRAA